MPQVPRQVARVNKHVTNRVQMLWAPYVMPWAVIEHTGRRSKREYQTPVIATVHGGELYVPVLYGRESDWVKNLLAAGSGHVRRGGRRLKVSAPQIEEVHEVPGVLAAALGRFSGSVLRATVTPD